MSQYPFPLCTDTGLALKTRLIMQCWPEALVTLINKNERAHTSKDWSDLNEQLHQKIPSELKKCTSLQVRVLSRIVIYKEELTAIPADEQESGLGYQPHQNALP